MKSIAIGIAAAASVVWVAWPYLSAYSTAQAINDGDTVALETRVSWPAVRQGFKDDLNAALPNLVNEQQVDKAQPLGGLLTSFIPVMIDKMVDAHMTPSAFATRLREHKLDWRNVKYAFFANPTAFLVVLGSPEGSNDKRLEVMMQFQDFGWKVTRVYLPIKKILAESKEVSKALTQGDVFKKLTQNDLFKTTEAAKQPSQSVESAQSKSSETASRVANSEYIDKLRLYDLQARYFTDLLDGKVAGVTFKLKNEGSKTLKRVEVTVYFKDASGNIIREDSFNPVWVTEFSFGGDNKPLKPGYIWQIESGKLFKAKSVPSEWAEGRAEAKITRVEIDDQSDTEDKRNSQGKPVTATEDKPNPQGKAGTGGNSPTEKLIIAKKNDSVVSILRDLGATGADLNAISRVLGPRSFDGGIREGQRVRVLMATASDGQRLQPVRIIIANDSGIDVVVALSDTGKYVSVDVKNDETEIAATSRMAAKPSQSEIDALRARLMALWSPPVGVQDLNELIVNVTIKLGPDGRLAAPPVARANGRSVAAMASRDSAVRAVLTGQPFDMLKPEHYESWKVIELTFDPRAK